MDTKTPLSITDLKEIQAGPVAAIPTRYTAFLFFVIKDANKFRHRFQETILPVITTSFDARTMREEVMMCKGRGEMATLAGVNVSFSHIGLCKLFGNGDPNDEAFTQGQSRRADDLGDEKKNWLPAFAEGEQIDGFFEVAGYPGPHVIKVVQEKIMPLFAENAASLKFDHYGQARPGNQKGHEHFGFNDGISQPFVKFEDDNDQLPKRKNFPGQTVVDPGVLVIGHKGDPLLNSSLGRPEWAKNGSFVAYRHLKQLVPEFNNFLRANYIKLITEVPIPTPQVAVDDDVKKGMDFLGARLMGRWKSGMPVVFTPLTGPGLPMDNPEVGKDKWVNNDFDYGPRAEPGQPELREQFKCPFAAHARKTGPRTDISQAGAEARMIRRGGIAYGWEVQPEEVNKTRYERGLSFVCYQSSLVRGFEFIQKSWSNNEAFPPNTGEVVPGFDLIIGQNHGKPRTMKGSHPLKLTEDLTTPEDFIISQGGEYFFLPSIKTLKQMMIVPVNLA